MPTPRKHPDRYGKKHYEALCYAYDNGELPMHFLNHNAATSYRMTLYTIRQCVMDHPDWKPEWRPDIVEVVKDLTFAIDESTLIVRRKNHDANSTETAHVS